MAKSTIVSIPQLSASLLQPPTSLSQLSVEAIPSGTLTASKLSDMLDFDSRNLPSVGQMYNDFLSNFLSTAPLVSSQPSSTNVVDEKIVKLSDSILKPSDNKVGVEYDDTILVDIKQVTMNFFEKLGAPHLLQANTGKDKEAATAKKTKKVTEEDVAVPEEGKERVKRAKKTK
jgi:hypothetical protein